jgi:hypothetical protein
MSREARLTVDEIEVSFADSRRHRVAVEERSGGRELRLWGVAPRRPWCRMIPKVHTSNAWKRNRFSDLVGFKIDGLRSAAVEEFPSSARQPMAWSRRDLADPFRQGME